MKKTLTRIISALLALIMTMLVAVSCVKQPQNPDETEATSDSATSAETEAPTDTAAETDRTAVNLLGARDFKGETVTFYVRQYGGVWDSDIVSHEFTSEIVNDAIYRRTKTIEDTFKVKLDSVAVGNTGEAVYTKIKTEIQGDDHLDFDCIHVGLRDTAFLITSGVLQNLKNVPNIKLDADYWNPFLTKQLSIAGKIYGITGEISAEDNMSVRCYFFNKDIAKDNLGLDKDYFYNLVANKKWTFEEVFKCSNEVFSDGGDGVADPTGEGDMFGIAAQVQFGFMMLMGTGTRIIDKDNSDVPFLSLEGNNHAINIVDKLTQNISGNPSVLLKSNSVVIKCFTDGKSLFMPEVLQHAGTMRNSNTYDIDFGILPMPLWDSSQENYVQYSDAYCPDFFSIPVNIKDSRLDRITFILEATAIESRDTLTPAYYEICLKGRYSTDEQSAAMIDIILSNYNIDLCDVFLSSWNDFRSTIQNAISGGGSITTAIKINKKPLNLKIQETVDKIKELP